MKALRKWSATLLFIGFVMTATIEHRATVRTPRAVVRVYSGPAHAPSRDTSRVCHLSDLKGTKSQVPDTPRSLQRVVFREEPLAWFSLN